MAKQQLAQHLSYWQIWDLLTDPFAPSENRDWYFSHPEWEQQLDVIQHLLFNSNTILTVVSDFSEDTATFVQHLLKQCEPDSFRVCQLKGSPALSAEQFPEIFAEHFRIPIPDNENLTVILEHQLTELQFLPHLSCLIINDAHLCPQNTLKSLVNLISEQSENQMHLHVMLMGNASLKEYAADLFKQMECEELLYCLELKPLTREQTKLYLQNRIVASGGLDKKPFSEMDVMRIHKQSGGELSKIHQLAREILIEKSAKLFKKSASPSAPALTRQIWQNHQKTIIGGSILMVALLVVSYISEVKFPKQALPTAHSPVRKVASIKQDLFPVHYPAEAKLTPIPIHLDDIHSPAITLHSYVEPVILAPKVAEQQNPTNLSSEKSFPVNNAEHYAGASPLVATNSFLTAIDKDRAHLLNIDTNSTKKFIAHAPKIQVDASPLHYPVPVAQASVTPIPNSMSIKTHNDYRLKEVSKDPDAKLATTVSQKIALTVDEEHLLKLPKRYFTLQLIAVSKKGSKQDLLQSANIDGNYRLYRTKRQDAMWYVAVYGQFRTAQEARAAIKKLPPNLQVYKPWPKLIGQVQKEIHTL